MLVKKLLAREANFIKVSPDDLVERVPAELLGQPWYDQSFEPRGAKQQGAPKEFYLFAGFVDCSGTPARTNPKELDATILGNPE